MKYKSEIIEELDHLEKDLQSKIFHVKHTRGIHHRKDKLESLETALGVIPYYRKLINETLDIEVLNGYFDFIMSIREHIL